MLSFEGIARISHEANRIYCESIGDTSQVKWKDAPEWQKQSAIQGVVAFSENPDMTPKQGHDSWMKVKSKDGWVYGKVKDPEKKTHPCMVEYDDLPEEQKVKDIIFKCVAVSLLNNLYNCDF